MTETLPPVSDDDLPDADTFVYVPVKLAYPRKIEGKPYREIRLREPFAYEMIEAMANHATAAARYEYFLGKLADAPMQHIRKLHAADYSRLIEAVDGFFVSGRPTS